MTETERSVRTFDKFFDCLNVRSPAEDSKKGKENLKPYKTATDERLLVNLFLIANSIDLVPV